MRRLISCPACSRQFETGDLRTGARFHCICGDVLEVPPLEPHEAAVVRCSACGAPRQEGSAICSFCSADFTLHERDLHTICPTCMTRVSDRARFCHHCAERLSPQALAAKPTEFECPACKPETTLVSRLLSPSQIPLLECQRCAGLWVDRAVFERLLEQAHAASMNDDLQSSNSKPMHPEPQHGESPPHFYRPCPVCRKLMLRNNFGRISGILLDSCREHGLWFDASELESLLRWIRSGGGQRSRRRQEEESRQVERDVRLRQILSDTHNRGDDTQRGKSLVELIGRLLEMVTAR